jgi:hypothetical protein
MTTQLPQEPDADASGIRIAHVVLAHKNAAQVNRFIHQLTGESRADVYLHVDAKCPDAVFREFDSGERVVKLAERISVSWCDYNTVEATLLALRAVKASGKTYDFISLNSGQDLLVRRGLAEYLAARPGRIFMEAVRFEANDPRNFLWRIKWPRWAVGNPSPWHWSRLFRLVLRLMYKRGWNPFPNRHPLPPGWKYHRGSQWFCLSGDALDFILDYLDREPSYADAFRDSIVPDMAFFQTLIMNTEHASNVTGANLTYLNFGTHFHDSNSPLILTMSDVPDIEASGRFFARKFELFVDAEVVRHFCGKV